MVDDAVRVTVAGSGDAFGSGGRLQACVHIRPPGDGPALLLDCGATSLAALKRQRLDPGAVATVVISHLHGDHFGGLPFLILDGQFAKRTQPLTVAGPPGITRRLTDAMEVMFPGSSTASRRFEVRTVDLQPGHTTRVGEVDVAAWQVDHPSGAPALALRLTIAGATIAYTGDTAWTEGLVEAAAGADLLLAEAYYWDKPVPYHLTHADLTRHRDRLAADRVVLTHMSADMLRRPDDSPFETAHDGLVIDVPCSSRPPRPHHGREARKEPSVAGYGDFGSSLRDLPRLRTSRRRRASSWDRTGGNDDRVTLEPGATAVLADISGAGSVSHIWMTVAGEARPGPQVVEPDYLRRLVLRIFWDGQEHPSVLVPLGDFFGVGHARTTNFVSAPLQMSPQDGRALNCFFHMPFAEGARIEVTSELGEERVLLYYYVDYEEFDTLEPGLGRFHAQWCRENPTDGVDAAAATGMSNTDLLFGGVNTSGDGNYVILEAEGRGHYVGCVLNIHNLRDTQQWNWYGEGDDMIFVDGEPFPPRLHGTGTEDYFNTAWCPSQAYHAPYHGITLPGGPNWSGQVSMYRFHIEDPVTFERSIRVTIEHGHANRRSDDLSSVAYWYQTLPHRPFGLAPVEDRLPRAR